MLQRTMSLKEMMDYRPAAADFALCPEAVTGLMRLCIVAPDKEKAYDFLRHMMNPPYRQLALRSFDDCLNTVHYDFDGSQASKPTFILMAEYQVITDKPSLQALMETVIETRTDAETDVIADCFMKSDEGGSCLRIYSHEGQVYAAMLG